VDPIFGGQCKARSRRNHGVTCDADDENQVFIHEHQIYARPEIVEKCLLEDVDIL